MLTVSVRTSAWTINVTARPIYGLVQPWLNETHTHGHWAEDQLRLDIDIHGVFPQLDAHGVVGQSYRDGRVRNGRLDDYGATSVPNQVSSDGRGPEMWTSAQAEGAIEGVYTDYQLPRNPFSTAFKYSRYDREPVMNMKGSDPAGPDAPSLVESTKRMSTARERWGAAGRKKEL
jgi:hypothetical protein